MILYIEQKEEREKKSWNEFFDVLNCKKKSTK
jgi:hypothetical protein